MLRLLAQGYKFDWFQTLRNNSQQHLCTEGVQTDATCNIQQYCNNIGGNEGEVATTSLEFEYLHGKSRWEMLIGGYDINNDVITLGPLLMFVYIFLLFLLFADWGKSDSSVDGEPQGIWRWNSNSRDVIASSPWFFRPGARAPRRACSRAMPNSILDGFSDFKFSTQLVSTVVVAAITVFQVRFEFLPAAWVLYGASFNL